jgi:hypothetical protein
MVVLLVRDRGEESVDADVDVNDIAVGRDDIDKGILKTLARDARTGESGRMVMEGVLRYSGQWGMELEERSLELIVRTLGNGP